jgi:hypothetical protein
MSQENVEIVRIVLEAMSAGDRERVLSFADPGIVVIAGTSGASSCRSTR